MTSHRWLGAQSSFLPHFFPAKQGWHAPPPQSTSVSEPFFRPSPQPGPSHFPPLHTPLVQSGPAMHALPTPHFVGQPREQSTSVSVPFFCPSVQLGPTQRAPTQLPVSQSL